MHFVQVLTKTALSLSLCTSKKNWLNMDADRCKKRVVGEWYGKFVHPIWDIYWAWQVLYSSWLYDQLNQPFLDEGVVGVVDPSTVSLEDSISFKSRSFVSCCICFSYSLTSSIVMPYQSSIHTTAWRWPTNRTSRMDYIFKVDKIW